MSLSHSFQLAVDGLTEPWHVVSFDGVERLHEPFSFRVTTGYSALPAEALDVEAVVGQHAELRFALTDGTERLVHGVVEAVRVGYAGYVLTVVPRLGLLGETTDHQTFLAKTVVEIVEEVLGEHRVDVTSAVLRSLPKRDQCVQAFETDLTFVRRLLAEEGISFRFDHDGGHDTVVLVDDPLRCPDIEGDATLPFAEDSGLATGECVSKLSLRSEASTDAFSLRDYDFEKPNLPLEAEAKEGQGHLERYEFPGGFKEPTVGKALADIRLQEARVAAHVLRGHTNSRRLTAGRVLTIEGARATALNGRWLITEVVHEARETGLAGGERYRATFAAIPAAQAYRPARLPAPRLGGVQTATVTGPKGGEVHTDNHGRMTLLFRHDRRRNADETSSHWARSVQPPTSGGVMLPRTGWEVLVAFFGASGDMPFEIGRLYNGAQTPPEALPGAKVVSALGTRSTPGGGGSNIARLNDAAGAESMDLTASFDYSELIENERAAFVTGLEKIEVGADYVFSVGERYGKLVLGTLKQLIVGKNEISTKTNHELSASTEITLVGGARLFRVGGDYKTTTTILGRRVGAAKMIAAIESQSRKVTGPSLQVVGSAWTQTIGLSAGVSVLGKSDEIIAGPRILEGKKYELKAKKLTETFASRDVSGGKIVDEFKGDATWNIGGAGTITAPEVKITGHVKITFDAGGSQVIVEPTKVTVSGKFAAGAQVILKGDEKDSG